MNITWQGGVVDCKRLGHCDLLTWQGGVVDCKRLGHCDLLTWQGGVVDCKRLGHCDLLTWQGGVVDCKRLGHCDLLSHILPGRVVLWIVRDMVGGVCITVLASEKKNKFLHVHSRLSNIVQSIYIKNKARCNSDTLRPQAATKSKMGVFRIKVTVKVKSSLNMVQVSFERVTLVDQEQAWKT